MSKPELTKTVVHNDSTTVSKVRIYTKTGDRGESSLYNGERRRKDDEIFQCLGNIDELSSTIGLAYSFLQRETASETSGLQELMDRLEKIQCILQDLGSHIATPGKKKSTKDSASNERKEEGGEDEDSDSDYEYKSFPFHYGEAFVKELEVWIDEYYNILPKLTKFILPSGPIPAAQLHLARTVCRKTERSFVPILELMDINAFQYINRLSDFLFAAARYASYALKSNERIYIRRSEPV
ncbi:hypothetical protein BB560_003091 [Smittium megazygosporum]|uniref:Cobalamin adenosyltransferase-like domain-containing protein n=1 Tax=Smittium megazygosporum TaxID=133381 RepID=A0A2T9ZD26_9FUNG|nr:hypothetical protein BB560_003091 [Smittium megazygosporum]